ncbi:hypothetical protein CDAR_56571, partial [Caerostris darwini]
MHFQKTENPRLTFLSSDFITAYHVVHDTGKHRSWNLGRQIRTENGIVFSSDIYVRLRRGVSGGAQLHMVSRLQNYLSILLRRILTS